MKKKFEKIIGGTEKEVYKKFPWLKKVEFENAIIDITNFFFIWKNGVWKNGVWEYGIWEDGEWLSGTWLDGDWFYGVWKNGLWKNGVWEDGLWKNGVWEKGIWRDGLWKNGVWKGGKMWSNLEQIYIKVKSWDKENEKFIKKK